METRKLPTKAKKNTWAVNVLIPRLFKQDEERLNAIKTKITKQSLRLRAP